MEARAVPLTEPRVLSGRGGIIVPLRFDIPDYGPPGNHFGGPWAKTKGWKPGDLGGEGGEGGEGGLGGDMCVDRRGNYIARSVIGLAAGTTNVAAPHATRGRAKITHIAFWSDNLLPVLTITATFKVAEDFDTTGGLNTTGTRIRDTGGLFDVNPYAVPQYFYPNFIVDFGGEWFLKCILDNQSAGVVNAMFNATIELL